MLGGIGGWRLRARIAMTTSPLAMPASGAGVRESGNAVFRHTRENLHELAIAIDVVLQL